MDLDILKTFLVVCETKNFSESARRLRRSQSAISLQVKRLEDWVGQSLLQRDTRNVVLTSQGEEMVSYAKRFLNLEREIKAHFHEPLLEGRVRFGVPEDIATVYLPPILARFAQDYPSIILEVNCELTVNLLNRFEANEYDLILIKQDPNRPYVNSEEVWKESLAWVGSSKIKKKGEIGDKKPLSLVLAPPPCVYRKRAIDALEEAHLAWRAVYTSPSLTGVIAAVKAGLGISVLPKNKIPKGLEALSYLPNLKDAQIALLKKIDTSQAVSAFAEYISNHINKKM